ncbi:MAG TPA: ATPase, T2SS/T4P/T4SS family [Tepidisphaeraceae bacterium]|jgi:general secretion pathway protein E
MAQPYLEVSGADGTRQVPINDQPITIGRHATNLVVLADQRASRYHCVIEKASNTLTIRDLDSSNGTKVNGRNIKSMRIGDGDVVQIGGTLLKVVAPSLAPLPARTPAAPASVEDVEIEDEFDVVEVEIGEEEEDDDSEPVGFEAQLVRMAESLPDKKIGENGIALINARGELAHPARKAPPAEGRDAVGILRLILLICFRSRASDIHIEPKQEDFSVRIRTDGTMVDVVRLPKDVGTKLTSLVKILCDIDISQRSIVQEGHFSANVAERRVDYRVSFAPAMFGQKLVVRILDTANTPFHVWDLQLPDWMYEEVMRAVKSDSGMVLVCGPTGSGKTSSLYAVIRDIDVNERNVVTIEDPIEIQLDGVTQIPVNEEKGNGFSSLLRSVLRQDPDAILVGEVRDPETARIALQAAITGHLVFSTIHAKDTIGTIFRLFDLGVEPYLVASGLQLVLGQRLVRVLCQFCKQPVKPTADQLNRMGEAGQGVTKLFQPKGCPRCMGTGFSGRRAMFELLRTTEAMRDLIMKTPTLQELQKSLDGSKFVKLSQSGYLLVAQGATSLEEIERSM